MKKIYTLIMLIACAALMSAQSIDFTKDGRHYYSASPNGKYYIGTTMGDETGGIGCFYNAETRKHFATDSARTFLFTVNNNGDAVGSNFGYASIWHQGGEWEKLPGVNGQEFAKGEILSMSADGNKFMTLIEISEENFLPVLYTKKDGQWSVNKLPAPKTDEVYKMKPQFLQVCGMNYEATRIFGRFVTEDGQREVPFVWEKGAAAADDKYDGWNFRFLVSKAIVNKNVVIADIQPKSSFTNVLDYQVYRLSFESGVLFDMSPYSLVSYNGTGKYLPINVKLLNAEETYDSYAGVIDVDKDSLIIIKSVANGGTLSVSDKGEVMVYSPAEATFRSSYVVSLDNIEKAETLTEYTKKKTNGKIDLSQYMNYQRLDGEFVVAEGSAVWATEGNAFVTFNYDEYNQNNVPHCYMVRFDGPVGVEKIEMQEATAYPNPTSGALNFAGEMEEIEVFDLSGRKVYSQRSICETIDLSALPTGTYVMTGIQKGEKVMNKIVIAR